MFGRLLGLLLGDHALAGATPSKWPTETALAVTVGHHNGVTQTFTLKIGVNLSLKWLLLSHFWRSFEVGNAG